MSLNSRRNTHLTSTVKGGWKHETDRKILSPSPPPLLRPSSMDGVVRSSTAWDVVQKPPRMKRSNSGGSGSGSAGGSRSSVESIGVGLGLAVNGNGGVGGLESPHAEDHNHLNAKDNNNDIEQAEYIVDRSTRTTYLKGKFLGKGGFARVHELTDLTTNKVFAGKIIAKSHITQPHHRDKIAREVELQNTLKHRHVVQFRHYFEDDLNVYIILENCSRKSLVHVMKHRASLTEPEVRYYMKQLVDGVQYIHNQNVIHRDLKLGNMFLTDDMQLKIGDFGLATRMDNSDPKKKATICGTPNYIAPEVLNKEGHGFPADIWAMGCILYAMLVGQPPFETVTLKETYIRIMTNNYVIPPLISTWSSNLISSLLHPIPKLRPTLDQLREHEFFSRGYCPNVLSPSCCHTTPRFPVVNDAVEDSTISNQQLAVPNSRKSNDYSSSPVYDSVSATQLVSGRSNNVDNELNRCTFAMSQIKLRSSKSAELISRNGGQPTSSSSGTKLDKLARNDRLGESRKEKDLTSSIKQKITSVLCPDKTSNSKKQRSCSAATLFHVLNTCLDNMPDEVVVNPPCTSNCPVQFVTKWIDYSNKYGFGFQLSDRSVGVLFNDSTRIGFSPDKSRVEFIDLAGKLTVISPPNIPHPLKERYTLLAYFAQYMDENLTEGGEIRVEWGKRKGLIPHMKRWLRTSRAIIMQLSTGGLQVNFFKDHTKIILSLEKNEYLVTYINEDRRASTYKLLQITNMGCNVQIRERLLYALNILKEFANIERDGED
ncbi:hypothetical protein CHUAL_006486 [Chamberlinius hualienensis]